MCLARCDILIGFNCVPLELGRFLLLEVTMPPLLSYAVAKITQVVAHSVETAVCNAKRKELILDPY